MCHSVVLQIQWSSLLMVSSNYDFFFISFAISLLAVYSCDHVQYKALTNGGLEIILILWLK